MAMKCRKERHMATMAIGIMGKVDVVDSIMQVSKCRLASELGFLENVIVGNALIDMYAKCSHLDGALCAFNVEILAIPSAFDCLKLHCFMYLNMSLPLQNHYMTDGMGSLHFEVLMGGVRTANDPWSVYCVSVLSSLWMLLDIV
ncbi:hypothetical protein Vadar_011308 [Vaccinium darrowii]|uniref:Uncharacterized protein n=1 Tax=Vaccinium darrowii TaxID=229202 RepID=A0ACB7WZU4_9ERIC|nr:hypothetical protein Vadar_011308 [Vaccinium darrowii]